MGERDGDFELYGHQGPHGFTMDRIFLKKEVAQDFCETLKQECLKQFPDNRGDFMAYNFGLTQLYAIFVTYVDADQQKVTTDTCYNVMLKGDREVKGMR